VLAAAEFLSGMGRLDRKLLLDLVLESPTVAAVALKLMQKEASGRWAMVDMPLVLKVVLKVLQ